MIIPVTVDSHLKIDGNLLGHDLAGDIFDELTFPNSAKTIAERANRWGWWDMPDEFCLGELDGDTLILPRGYALQLKFLLRENNHQVLWIDRRTWKRGAPLEWKKEFNPRTHQIPAKKKIRKHEQGIYEAPTGSGKSLTCIYLTQEISPQQTIILVDKLSLLEQWRREIKKWLKVKVGVIGSGKWNDDERFTVATVQSIWSMMKKGKIPKNFFKRFSCVVVDECHHISADSIEDIVSKFWARFRFGVSATPDRNDNKFFVALSVLGEVIHSDDENKLRQRGVLVKPCVRAVRTNFSFTYWPDHQSDVDHNCVVPRCRLDGKRKHRHQNNYRELKTALVSDAARNELVCDTVWEQVQTGDHHHLIITDEVRHVEALYTKFLEKYPHSRGLPGLYLVTGAVKKREKLFREIKASKSSILISTVAKEGLDIPVIDRVYLPFPSGNIKVTQQKVGRGTRVAEGKIDYILFDFQDVNVDLLKKQFKNRADKLYRKSGMEVIL